jgi:hypothetical protein
MPNTVSLSGQWRQLGMGDQELLRAFRTFNAAAEPFQKESGAHESHEAREP